MYQEGYDEDIPVPREGDKTDCEQATEWLRLLAPSLQHLELGCETPILFKPDRLLSMLCRA